MSTTALLTWLVLLPASTWLVGSLLTLLDLPDMARALRRVAWSGLPFLAAALLLGRAAALPALAALVTALLLHLTWTGATHLIVRRGWLVRNREDI